MDMLFIGGTGRCGTNVAKELMTLHPNAFSIPFELRMLIDENGLCDFYRCVKELWTPQKIHIKFEKMKNMLYDLGESGTIHYKDWNLAQDAFPTYFDDFEQFLGDLPNMEFDGYWIWMKARGTIPIVLADPPRVADKIRTFFTGLLEDCTFRAEQTLYVDDGTFNMTYSHILAEIFPKAKFLHMYRKADQVIGSMIHQRWCPNTVEDTISWYIDIHKHMERSMSHVDKDRILHINMDDMLRTPISSLKKICDLVDLDIPEKFLSDISTFDLTEKHEYHFETKKL